MNHTIACVLKTGIWKNRNSDVEYGPQNVRWLRDQVAAKYSYEHRFVCLSDIKIDGVETIPLLNNWPGWWSKMELFRPGIGLENTFYIDLDTVIVRCIDNLIRGQRKKFQCLRNLSSPTTGRIGSGVMAWNGDYSYLYEAFKTAPDVYMKKYVTSERYGDQGFIQDHLPGWEHLQDRHQKQIVSYKIDMKQKGNPPPDARIVCFHGEPKPHAVEKKHKWIPPLYP